VVSRNAIAVGGTQVSTVENNGLSKWLSQKFVYEHGLLFSLIKECTSWYTKMKRCFVILRFLL